MHSGCFPATPGLSPLTCQASLLHPDFDTPSHLRDQVLNYPLGLGGSPVYKWYTGKDNDCIFLRPIGSQQPLGVGYGPEPPSQSGRLAGNRPRCVQVQCRLLALTAFSPTPLFNDFLLLNKTQGNTIKNNFFKICFTRLINPVCGTACM